MIKPTGKTHKQTRISTNWGEEYTYYERNKQLAKARRLMEEHHRGRRHRK